VVNKVTLAYLASNLSALLLDELGLHDIGKKWHCDILFFHDIYCDIKTDFLQLTGIALFGKNESF